MPALAVFCALGVGAAHGRQPGVGLRRTGTRMCAPLQPSDDGGAQLSDVSAGRRRQGYGRGRRPGAGGGFDEDVGPSNVYDEAEYRLDDFDESAIDVGATYVAGDGAGDDYFEIGSPADPRMRNFARSIRQESDWRLNLFSAWLRFWGDPDTIEPDDFFDEDEDLDGFRSRARTARPSGGRPGGGWYPVGDWDEPSRPPRRRMERPPPPRQRPERRARRRGPANGAWARPYFDEGYAERGAYDWAREEAEDEYERGGYLDDLDEIKAPISQPVVPPRPPPPGDASAAADIARMRRTLKMLGSEATTLARR